MRKSIYLFVLIACCLQSINAQLELDSTTITTSVIAENLATPWEILWGPDDKIWITERGGTVSRIDPGTGNKEVLLEIDEVVEESESGLLGMVLHPNFQHPDSQFVYLVYTYDAPSRTEKLVRYTLDSDKLIDPLILLDNIPASTNHDGSRVIITPDRTIMMSTGDARSTSYPQDTGSLPGKILRINLDGSVPDDNPLAGNYIWSFGHRNPQGLVLAPNGILYSSEHGPSNDDEINIINKNGNYGWPNVEGFCDQSSEQTFCAANNVTEPIFAWTPTLAVAGLDYYNHDAIPEWKHSLLLASLKEDDLRVLKLNTGGDEIMTEAVYFNNHYGRLRDICVSPSGDIYFSTSNRDGRANGGFPNTEDDRIIRLSNESYTPVTGLDKPSEKLTIRLYPNPVENVLYLDHPSGETIRIYDLASRLVHQDIYSHTIDVSNLHQGLYILEIDTGNAILKGKFLKK